MEEYKARTIDRCEVGKACCALRILQAEPDFLAEKSLLETVIDKAGYEAVFYPKFHCKLNYIEYYGAALKRYTRDVGGGFWPLQALWTLNPAECLQFG